MSALQDIQNWFAQRALWQWRAFEHIFNNQPVDQQFIKELADQCELDASDTADRQHQPHTIDDAVSASSIVQILGVEDVQNVNSLAPNQKLTFGASLMTVVYGDNGSGKTGYGRILRQVCRSRGGRPELLGNVYSENTQPGSATIHFSIDGIVGSAKIETSSPASPTVLQSFSIFDRSAASVLVERDNEAAFRPFGLDILDRFTKIADDVKAELLRRNSEASVALLDVTLFAPNSAARAFVSQLGAKDARSKYDKFIQEPTPDEIKRIKELEEIISKTKFSDPKKLAATCRLQAYRFENLETRLKLVHEALNPVALETAIDLKKSFVTAQQASDDARRFAFSDSKLDGVGQESWKALWEAARRYSEQNAYPTKIFPNVEDGAHCVLCSQPLSPEASSRLTTLETFVKGSLQEKADRLKASVARLAKKIELLLIREEDRSTVDELTAESQETGREAADFLSQADEIANSILIFLRDQGEFSANASLQKLPTSLPELIESLRKKAADYERLASQGKISDLEEELLNLKEKHLLHQKRDQILSEITRLERVKTLSKAAQSANTMAASQFSNELTKKYVSDALCNRFKEEIATLGLIHIKVELASAGARKGVTRHKIRLESIQPANPEDVISDGEFRCLALAAFLAEISDNPAGILFDDPVCSLDHLWREKIAERLLQEAKKRQVIVFTHDLTFASLLDNLASSARHNLTITHRTVQRRGDAGAGFCGEGMSWVNMPTKGRRGALAEELVRLKKLNKNGDPSYEREIVFWYGKLREAWERAVEELLFNGAVVRFRRSIETSRLKKALDAVKSTDFQTIEKGMSRCSQFLPGHDTAAELNAPTPSTQDADSDFNDFENWTKQRAQDLS